MPDANPDEDRLLADCAQLLTVTLADPAEFDFYELLERMERQVEDNEPVAGRWLAAINRVQQAGRLTLDQAHALMRQLALIAVLARISREPDYSDRARRIREIIESLKDLEGSEDAKERGPATREMNALFHLNGLRHDAAVLEFLRRIGEDQLARRMETEGPGFNRRAMDALKELWSREDADAGWKVSYPSADGPLTPRQVPERTDSQVERISVADRVDQWRQATSGETIWTVDALLAFATVESYDNLDGEGDRWIASIQSARRKGILDKNLSYLLLDRVAGMMVPEDPGGDTVLRELDEVMEEIPYFEGLPEADPPIEYEQRDREQWEAVHAVYERRRELYKLRILEDAGEEEMVKMIEERPTEFRMRVATAATEWEVEDQL
jgi:hypothetical protein